jgi:hypothetical protein
MPKRQALQLVKPMHAFMVVPPAFATQHHEYPLTSVMDSARGNFPYAHADSVAVTRLCRISKGRP